MTNKKKKHKIDQSKAAFGGKERAERVNPPGSEYHRYRDQDWVLKAVKVYPKRDEEDEEE